MRKKFFQFTILMALACLSQVHAATFETAVTLDTLDPGAFAEWVDGQETPITEKQQKEGPRWLVWTKTTYPGHSGYNFGSGKKPGLRHLRLGFKTSIPVGSVIARGENLSVLKSDAPYPGDLTNESQWIPAQQVFDKKLITDSNDKAYTLWVLPPGTTTRAIRFTKNTQPTEKRYTGFVGGIFVLANRFENIAPEAAISVSTSSDAAGKIIDQRDNHYWDNGVEGGANVVSPENAESILLIWPKPRKLSGLAALHVGFGQAEVQAYTGPADRHPRDATENDWKTVTPSTVTKSLYPVILGVNWLPFSETVETRGIRVRITKAMDDVNCHPHQKGNAKNGKRVWLGELMALSSLGDAPLVAPIKEEDPNAHPPIPVKFTLKEPSYVTLVIEDAQGVRVRNLLSETLFPAGENIAWWDGLDDIGRDFESATHGQYRIPGKPVEPGNYKVRGLFRKKVELSYEFPFYTNGNPPWATQDGSGEWLANHSAPSAALFVPGSISKDGKSFMLLGSYVTEGGSGLAWVDLNGKKFKGVGWLGGVWTGAPYLALDSGAQRNPDYYAYAASTWEGELRLTGLLHEHGGNKPVLKYKFPNKGDADIKGLAVRDGLIVCSMPKAKSLLFADAKKGTYLGTIPFEETRGIAFDAQGRLLALTKDKLFRIKLPEDLTKQLADAKAPLTLKAETLVSQGLEDAFHVTTDKDGNLYVSDKGKSHQIKVFSPEGKSLRAIGEAGVPKAGLFNPKHINNPEGLSISDDGHLWVAECDFQPKRISVWTLSGEPVMGWNGPGSYGNGGTLDPQDKSRLYYYGMEFKLDWEKGTHELVSVYNRPAENELSLTGGHASDAAPEYSMYVDGRQYLCNAFNSNPTNGASFVGLWMMKDHVARPVAAVGRARSWTALSEAMGIYQHFGAKWTGFIEPKFSEEYTFQISSDDGSRLWVDGKLIIDDWHQRNDRVNTGKITLKAGAKVSIRIDYHQDSDGARMRMSWQSASQKNETIPAPVLYAAADAQPGGLKGEYFTETDMTGLMLTQVDSKMDINWPNGCLVLPETEKMKAFKARIPQGVAWGKDPLLVAWSDLNGDAQLQPEELTFAKTESSGIVYMPDLTAVTALSHVLKPNGFAPSGAPIYDASTAPISVPGARAPNTSGGGQALIGKDGWTVLTVPPAPYPAQSSLAGAKDGKPNWTYPDLWNGLHPSHIAPVPDRPGMVIGTTRLLGGFFSPKNSDAGECWAINGNMGNMYVFTSDGLFVTELFRDVRTAPIWNMPLAERGMKFTETSLHDENFFPTLSQTPDGNVYVITNSCLVRVDGLETVRRIPAFDLPITSEQLLLAQRFEAEQEAKRQAARGTDKLVVMLKDKAPVLDGKFDDWAGAQWAEIDARRTQSGDWGSKLDRITGAVCISGDKLYAAYHTFDQNLLKNSGETWQTLFKHGGCLDLMIGTDAKADPKRGKPAAGDLRLLITRVKDKTMAVLYRPVVSGAKGEKYPFTSPVSTIYMDQVETVSEKVELAAGPNGDFEIAVPLSLLGLKPEAGTTIKADIGILRGNGFQTNQRVYWSNKATSITADVPSEAALTPNLWGRWTFEK